MKIKPHYLAKLHKNILRCFYNLYAELLSLTEKIKSIYSIKIYVNTLYSNLRKFFIMSGEVSLYNWCFKHLCEHALMLIEVFSFCVQALQTFGLDFSNHSISSGQINAWNSSLKIFSVQTAMYASFGIFWFADRIFMYSGLNAGKSPVPEIVLYGINRKSLNF